MKPISGKLPSICFACPWTWDVWCNGGDAATEVCIQLLPYDRTLWSSISSKWMTLLTPPLCLHRGPSPKTPPYGPVPNRAAAQPLDRKHQSLTRHGRVRRLTRHRDRCPICSAMSGGTITSDFAMLTAQLLERKRVGRDQVFRQGSREDRLVDEVARYIPSGSVAWASPDALNAQMLF